MESVVIFLTWAPVIYFFQNITGLDYVQLLCYIADYDQPTQHLAAYIYELALQQGIVGEKGDFLKIVSSCVMLAGLQNVGSEGMCAVSPASLHADNSCIW